MLRWVFVWLRECFTGYWCDSKSVSLGIRVAQSVWLDIRVDEYVFRWVFVWFKMCLAGLSCGSKSMFRLVFVWFKVYVSLGIHVARSVCFA